MSNTNYNLNNTAVKETKKPSNWAALGKLINLLPEQRSKLIWALIVILVYSMLTMVGPYIVGITINDFILNKKWNGVLRNCGWLLLL